MKRALVVLPLNDAQKKTLEGKIPGVEYIYLPREMVNSDIAGECSAIVGNISADIIRQCDGEKLELIQLNSAGADEYVREGVIKGRTVLANATGAYDKTVAEHAFALTLSLMKKLYLYRDNQRNSDWKDMGNAVSFEGSTVVVMGLGSIGRRYAAYAKALGAYVIGVKKRQSDVPACADELCLTDDADRVLPRADIVVSFLPSNEETKYFYTADRFSIMKRTTLFINCGRGNAVKEEVLLEALSENKIAAAAIDVAENEPLPKDSRLWNVENLVITPHTAGGYHLEDTLDKIADIAAYNLNVLVNGGNYMNAVDMKTGYKA